MEKNRVSLKQKISGEKLNKERKKLKRKLRNITKQKLLDLKKNDIRGALQILYTSVGESDTTGAEKANLEDIVVTDHSPFDVAKTLLEKAAKANSQLRQNGENTNWSSKKKTTDHQKVTPRKKVVKKAKKKLAPKQQVCESKVENLTERFQKRELKSTESKSEFFTETVVAEVGTEEISVCPIMIETSHKKDSAHFILSVSKMKTSVSPAAFNFRSVSSTLQHPAYSSENDNSFAEYGCLESSFQTSCKDFTSKAIDRESALGESIAKLLNMSSVEDNTDLCNGSISESFPPPENKYEFFIIGGDKVLLLMEDPCTLYFRGVLQVQIIAGAVEVLGYKFESGNSKMRTMFSARGSSLLGLQTCHTDNDVWENIKHKLTSLQIPPHTLLSLAAKFSSASSLLMIKKKQCSLLPYLGKYFPILLFETSHTSQTHLSDIQSCLQCEFIEPHSSNPTKCYVKSKEWENLVESLDLKERATHERLCIMMCGGKSVGKSTCLRFLINRCLDDFGKVLYVDLDPGQSEFTVPGCVSAVLVHEPLLGPNYTHIARPCKMVYIGNVNVATCPIHYVRCIQDLLKFCSSDPELAKIPWFVNTMGFSQGLGVDLTVNIIKLTGPSNLIQIESHAKKRNFPELLTPLYVMKHASSIYLPRSQMDSVQYQFHCIASTAEFQGKDTSQWGLEARKLRELNILSYFHKTVSPPGFSLLSVTPFVKSFANLKLCISHERVVFSQYLSAMNGSLVGLCHVGDVPGVMRPSDSRFPHILQKPPVCECLGFGIVRGVDMDKHQVYITTPASAEDMQKVDCLILGPVTLPATVYTHTDRVVGRVPYVVTGAQPVMAHTLRATRSLVSAP